MHNRDKREAPVASAAGVTRRGIFAALGASTAAAATPAVARNFGSGFTHSVASGEPQATSVLLWTRYASEQETRLEWQISESEDFANVVAGGEAAAVPARDFCAKVTADGLLPDRWYFYRFVAPTGTISPIGRTRTLPDGPTGNFRMAIFSCANFGFGYFNAYAHAAEVNDVDLAVHLGDYIYEYGSGNYPSPDQRHPDRPSLPDGEIITLADYRLRYASYRTDPDLQRLHQILPMIAVWDDHESTNDSWKDGAQNHQPDEEGEWAVRKAIAKQVYREWMPVSDKPYAAYDVGDLATLFRVDTRLEGRDEQFSFTKVIEDRSTVGAILAALRAFRDGPWRDPARQMLGASQERWLIDGFAASKARGAKWQVLVQQVLMGKLSSPRGIIEMAAERLPGWLRERLQELAYAAEASLPTNMDAWDGYPAARERVFQGALDVNANLLVLAGDTHNAWGFELEQDRQKVGVELGVCSVSSPGFESFLTRISPHELAQKIVDNNAELAWADTSQRGYMVVELTPERAITEYRFVAGLKQRSTELAGTKRIVSEAGSGTLTV
ncbi:MAG: alkaline phosphatase D family protein [Pseudomonadota bacterium]